MAAKGINGYTGVVFSDFTRGDTLPFTFQFMDETQSTPIPVDGWIMVLSISSTMTCAIPDLEVDIPPTDPANGLLSGYISDDETYQLTPGVYYACAKYIKPNGQSYIIDMASIDVLQCVTPRRDQ